MFNQPTLFCRPIEYVTRRFEALTRPRLQMHSQFSDVCRVQFVVADVSLSIASTSRAEPEMTR